MRSLTILTLALGLAANAPVLAAGHENKESPLTYPETKTVDVVEEQFGEYISDPYRWLENDVREDPEVADWVKAQNAVTDAYLETLPGRDSLAQSMKELFDYDDLGIPVEAGGKYFYERKSGGQNQAVLYVRDGVDGEERVLIDPATWSDDGATALANWKPSGDGSLLAYAVQDGGSDWRTLKVLDVETGEVKADTVEWAKFTDIVWMPKNIGFLYSRYPEPGEGEAFQSTNLNHAIYLHPVGNDQAKDIKVFATPGQPELNHFAELTSDKEWVMIASASGTDERVEVTMIKVDAPELETRKLVSGFDHDWRLIDGVGDTLYFETNKDAPRLRVVKTDMSAAEPEFTEVIAESDAVINGTMIVGDRLVVSYLVDAKSQLSTFDLDGKALGTLNLPGPGQVTSLSGLMKSEEGFFSFQSFNRPTTVFRYEPSSEPTVWAAPSLPFDPDTVEVTQRFYESKDGTKIPMFLVHMKGQDLSAGAPTMLYGYGGFNISVLPQYKPAWMAWIKAGGVFASANLRGGGEYGKEWHDAGRLQNKQNVFDDFIAAGEYLLTMGVTSQNGLAIEGRSNGGMLIGAVMNQRPDLFTAGHAAVGVMDMLRFDRFTAGRYWVDDYGYPDKEQDFRTQLAYSPYHNIKGGIDYPALIVSTADTDDRVVPGHSFKYTARLQALDTGDKPHLIRIETRAGHGSGKPTDKVIEEYSDIYAFLAHATGLNLDK
ncbi:prolyl oligopeptidase family serine peptidase [Parasphingorhabdus sp.]|uniref:prolyl oligopeptidase family serine peptidase n=1 Tax=Parasphingorhabdus sp. TaxID=2709688 RepID=UPI0030017DDB